MTRPDRWARATDWPLMVAAVLFLAAYAIPIIHPGMSGPWLSVCRAVTWVTWGAFVVDYVVRLTLASDRRRFLLRHWLDLLIIALPLLRPLRLLRLAALLSVLNRKATTGLRGRIAIYVTGGAALLSFCGSLAVLDAERANPQANIRSFGDAIWWAITTMTTVGYGDRFPITTTGRLAAVGLMIGGIAVLGVVTATLASWLIEHVSAVEAEQTETLVAQIGRLSAQLQHLECRLEELGRGGPANRAQESDPRDVKREDSTARLTDSAG